MATARLEKVNEFLTCTVCTEEYSDPCTLTCQHTFCRKCITRYTKTRPEAVRSKTIPCPCCRQVMKVPDPTRPVDEWAWQVKPIIIILGLIDTSQAGGTTTESNRCCGVCEHIGEITPARFWCPDCEVTLCDRCTKAHRGNPTSRDHEICDLSEEAVVKRQKKAMCREHKKNCIEFHCNDCKKSVCQKCCILYHRSCKSLVTIESMKAEMKSILDGKRQKLSKQLKTRRDKVAKKKDSISKASQKMTTNQSSIRAASQKAIDKIKQKEKQLMDKLNDVTDKQICQLQADVKTEVIEIQMYRQHYEFIDQMLKTDSVMDMYDMYQACLSGALVLEEDGDRDTTEREQIEEIRFTQDAHKLQRSLEDLLFGEIDITYKKVSESTSTPVQINTTDTRTGEKYSSSVDLIVLDVNGAQIPVVTDFGNKCVKSFFTTNNKASHSKLSWDKSPWSTSQLAAVPYSKKIVTSKLSLKSGPWGITMLNERQVLVAVPDSNEIVTIEVSPKLRLISTVSTGNKYYGLAVLNNTSMVAGAWFSGCVDILNMAGQVMQSIGKDAGLFSQPWSICVNSKGNILVADDGMIPKTVTCLTSEGDVVWTYTTDRRSRGITTLSTGSVLFADRDSSKIVQLTETGKFSRNVLTSDNGLKEPQGVYFDGKASLFVSDVNHLYEFSFVK